MMTAIVIDDEVHCVGTLNILLAKHCPNVHVVATALDGEEGIIKITKLNPDIIFLDIEMPRLNGFEMLSQLNNINCKIIFTTAYDNFAIKAFKVSAIDYLLKPIDAIELVFAIKKAEKQIKNNQQEKQSFYKLQIDSLLENLQGQTRQFPNIALPTLSGLEMVKTNDILYLESEGNYTKLIKSKSETILISKTLKTLEVQLESYNFVRIHHSHMVNLEKVTKYVQGEGGYVILSNGQHLNVSRRKKSLLLSKLKIV